MTLPSVPESMSLYQQDVEQPLASQVPPYPLRRNRTPRYRRVTCGSRNSSCFSLVEVRTPGKRLARGADVPFQDLVDMIALDHPQQDSLSFPAENQDVSLVHSIVITVEKTYSNIEPGVVLPL